MSLSDGTKTIIKLTEHDYGCRFCKFCMLSSFEESIKHHIHLHSLQETHRGLEYTRNTITGYSKYIYLVSKNYLIATNHNDNYDRAMKGL